MLGLLWPEVRVRVRVRVKVRVRVRVRATNPSPSPNPNPNPNQVCLLLRGFLRLHAPGTVPQPIGGCGTLTRPTVASDEVRRRFLSWDEAR